VLFDPHCRLCAFVAGWLTGQRKLIPIRLVPVGSPQARRLFPALDHDGATRREITVVGDAGQVYIGEAAWVVCLWALAEHRALAHAMSTPTGRRLARAAVLGAAKYRDSQSGARAAGAPSHPGPQPGRRATAPGRGAPMAGRRPPQEARQAWDYDGAGGWTPREPATGGAGDPGTCADGCAPPG
jgi:predicted DCC family thiol-disulfide oxidoreductase YuxK